MLKSIKQPAQAFLEKQSEESSSYILASLALITSLIARLGGFKQYSEAFHYLATVALIYGFIVFVNSLAKPIMRSGLGKLILSGAFVIGSGISLAMARQAINTELHVPASAYPITQSILAVLLAPQSLSVCLALTGVVLIVPAIFLSFMPIKITSMKSLLVSWKADALTGTEMITNIVRFFALVVVINLAMSFSKDSNGYSDSLASFSKWFAYTFESEIHSYCFTASDERVTYLSEKLIIISKQDGDSGKYSFRVDNCISSLK